MFLLQVQVNKRDHYIGLALVYASRRMGSLSFLAIRRICILSWLFRLYTLLFYYITFCILYLLSCREWGSQRYIRRRRWSYYPWTIATWSTCNGYVLCTWMFLKIVACEVIYIILENRPPCWCLKVLGVCKYTYKLNTTEPWHVIHDLFRWGFFCAIVSVRLTACVIYCLSTFLSPPPWHPRHKPSRLTRMTLTWMLPGHWC